MKWVVCLAAFSTVQAMATATLAETPRVIAIEPAASAIPANAFRWYIEFDRSARGWAHTRDLVLSTEYGAPVGAPFMDFGPELWSPDGRRLTVFFDPGRVKRDVEAPGETGAPIQAGRRYRLSVFRVEQRFVVSPALRAPLEPDAWRLVVPLRARQPLVIRFDRVMDSALCRDQIRVVDAAGRPMPGDGRLQSNGRDFSFKANGAWRPGSYRVEFGSLLEDVSGNRFAEALDHEAGTLNDEPGRIVSRTFVVEGIGARR